MKNVLSNVGYVILGIFKTILGFLGFGKSEPRAYIQCSKCNSKKISVTSGVSSKELKSGDLEFKYSIKCSDCGSSAFMTEKWLANASTQDDSVCLKAVDSIEGISCPSCGCDELVEYNPFSKPMSEGLHLHVCKNCNRPVAAVKDKKEDTKDEKINDIKEESKRVFSVNINEEPTKEEKENNEKDDNQ